MVVLYFLPIIPMIIVIALLARRAARSGSSAPRPNRFQVVLGLLAVIAMAVLAFWLAGVNR